MTYLLLLMIAGPEAATITQLGPYPDRATCEAVAAASAKMLQQSGASIVHREECVGVETKESRL